MNSPAHSDCGISAALLCWLSASSSQHNVGDSFIVDFHNNKFFVVSKHTGIYNSFDILKLSTYNHAEVTVVC